MSILFTELMFGSTGRAKALRLVHDGKAVAPPDTFRCVGAITRVNDSPAGHHADGLILRFRDDSGEKRPYFVWWAEGLNPPASSRPDPATRLVADAAFAFETVGRPVTISIMDGGDQ
jgi:hypothetical protein